MNSGQCEGCKNIAVLVDGVVCETCDEIYADTPFNLDRYDTL